MIVGQTTLKYKMNTHRIRLIIIKTIKFNIIKNDEITK